MGQRLWIENIENKYFKIYIVAKDKILIIYLIIIIMRLQ